MPSVPKYVLLGDPVSQAALSECLGNACETLPASSPEAAWELLRDEQVAGVCLPNASPSDLSSGRFLLQASAVLQQFVDGLALVDTELRIVWQNDRFRQFTLPGTEALADFYAAFRQPEILGPDFCPFHTALGSQTAAQTQLRIGDKQSLSLHISPVYCGPQRELTCLTVVVRDISVEVQQQQKLKAIYQAGLELGDLNPEEVSRMTVQDRIELLKQKILHYTQDVLRYENLEIRLLDGTGDKLNSLLVLGMRPDAVARELHASPINNGVTGFVAATGKSYLVVDTATDPLYLPGAEGARSSLTVPLKLQDHVQGTFNVESQQPGAFNEQDLQFLEIFGREVALALNTLDLLVAEKFTTANESILRVIKEVARPVDEILNEAAWVQERLVGQDPEVLQKLQLILRHTHDIKQLIQNVGEQLTPTVSLPPHFQRIQRPGLRYKRVLIADADDETRRSANDLLLPFGCLVESAPSGKEALRLIKQFNYDAVMADIRLPDMTGFEFFCASQEADAELPVILMTSFGYDAAHSIVKCRQRGLKSEVVYKPFKPHRMLDEVEKAVTAAPVVATTTP